jgi:glycosyltransferase involved in cell wall biosynthesis
LIANIAFSILGGIVFLQWLAIVGEALRFKKRAIEFATIKNPLPEDLLISVVVPARNEEKNLRASLKSLSLQTYKNLEVLLINDRSSDGTKRIMEEFVASHPHWRMINIELLPDGWLGKCNALQMGADQSQGEYILFTDGDIHFSPQALSTAVAVAREHHLDHLVLTPRFLTNGWMLASMQVFFSLLFVGLVKPGRIGRGTQYYIGAGAFNFVKRKTYENIGGHRKLRLEVIDDVMLGKLLVEGGGHTGFIEAPHLISVEWYPTWQKMILGLEKNGFAAFRYSLWRFLGMTLSMFWVHLLPYMGLFFVSGPAIVFLLAPLILSHLLFAIAAKEMGFPMVLTLLMPVAAWFVYFSHLRSTVLTIKRGYVSWRETKYSLKELKKHMA